MIDSGLVARIASFFLVALVAACGGQSRHNDSEQDDARSGNGGTAGAGGTAVVGGGTGGTGVTGGTGGTAGGRASGGDAGSAGSVVECDIPFEDPVLEAAVRDTLAIPSGPIPLERLAALEELVVQEVTAFGGIECASGLGALYVHEGSVEDISPLTALERLKVLFLGRKSFMPLELLTSLRALEELYLINVLSDANLEFVGRMPWLRLLDIEANGSLDLSPLAELSELETLNMDGTIPADVGQPSDLRGIGFVSRMPHLKEFSAYLSEIQDIDGFTGLRELEVLLLTSNAVVDLTPIAGAERLWYLNLRENQVTSLEPIRGLSALQELYVQFNPLADLGAVAEMSELTELHAEYTEVTDVTPLAGLTKLRRVYLVGTPVSNLTPLAEGSAPRDDCPQLDVTRTPLDAASLDEAIPKLCELGWVVKWGPPEASESCASERCTPVWPE